MKGLVTKTQQQAKKAPKVKLYPEIDVQTVRDFIDSKARNSRATATSYRDALQRLALFIKERHPAYDIESIITPLIQKEVDVYKLLDQLAGYLTDNGLSNGSAKLYMAAVRSFLQYCDVDIIPAKFKHRVNMPKERKEDEYALDAKEIRSILQGIYNRRLKAFCLVMASCGCRPVEGLAIRYKDIDFSVEPAKIYLQAKYSKNKLPREIYISSEATTELKKWLHNKYEDHDREPEPDDLVFSIEEEATPKGIYTNISKFFRDVLKSIKFDDRKDGVKNRRKITLYSFRRYVKTTTEDLAGHSFSEYMLGHKKSPYYVKKEPERRAMYKEKCEMHLTYLDYEPLEQHNKSMESTIEELKARVEKTEKGYGKYRESQKKMLSSIIDAFQHQGMDSKDVSASMTHAIKTFLELSAKAEDEQDQKKG